MGLPAAGARFVARSYRVAIVVVTALALAALQLRAGSDLEASGAGVGDASVAERLDRRPPRLDGAGQDLQLVDVGLCAPVIEVVEPLDGKAGRCDKLDCVNVIVLMADARVTGIPVEDCGEPLIDLSTCDVTRIDGRKTDPAGDWRQLRTGVVDRLGHAASALPRGLQLLHIEGYRPARLQARYFNAYRTQLAASRPDLDHAELHRLASRYVSPPDIAPHSAGAAIDLTLCEDDGSEVDMGTRVNASPEESGGGCYTDAASISAEARVNRGVLIAALSEAGLINYPTEWWHWSYGDRYWALQSGSPVAKYGTVDRSLMNEFGRDLA